MDANMLTGTEIYMKCIYALQQQNIADASMPTPPPPPTSNVSYYYPPKYAHHQQQSAFQYQSNQFLPQSHAVAPYFPSTSAFESVHVWPHQQQLYTTPLYSTSFDHHQSPLQSATQNGYFYNGLDRAGLYYGSHMPIAGNSSSSAVPTPSSSTCSEHNWPIPSKSENANHFDTTPVLYGQNGNRSSDTNHMTNSLNVDGSFDVTSQNNREVPMLDVKSRSLEMDARKKKIPRPMNSFMIYAKRHRAHVHQLYPLCDNRTISKILSDTWYSMDAEKKREYNELALEMRQEHFRLYPNFKWKTTSNETNEAQRKNSPTTTTVEPNVQSTALPEQHRMVGSDDSSEAFSGFQFDEYGDLVSPYMPATPSTETSLSPVGCGDKPLDDESKISQAIRLGPTPAQLGMCRNKKQSKGNASATGEDGNGINEDGLAMVSNQSQFKERFLNLPKFDFSNYRQTSEWDTSPTPAAITYNTTIRKRKSDTDQQQQQQTHHQLQPAKRLIGNRFFGPDFNVNHFKDIDASSQSSMSATPNSSVPTTPNTPRSADHVKYAKRKVQDNKKRQLMNQRQSLVMELFRKCGFFPSTIEIDEFRKEHLQVFSTKSFLNVKIREYRQKYMQNHSPQSQ